MRLNISYSKMRELVAILQTTPFDVSTLEGRQKERYRRIAMSALSALSIRGVGIFAAIITTPLTLGYLGVERFGLWMTITSITALLSFADFGIGSGLLNAISRADGENDKRAAQKALSSAFYILTLLGTLLTALFAIVYFWAPWNLLFGTNDATLVAEARDAVTATVGCIALSLPLATVLRVQMGYQEGFESNLWQFCANLGATVGVVVAALYEASLTNLVLASSGIPVLVTLLNWLHQFCKVRQWLMPKLANFDMAIGRDILTAGMVFALIQLVTFFGFFSDNFVISQFLGPGAVATYAIVYRIYSAIFIVQFILTPLWPAMNEAISRGDLDQARRMFKRATIFCVVCGTTIALMLIGFGRPVIALWVGLQVVPAWSLLFGFGAWAIIASYYAPISALLSGHNFIYQQLRILTLAASFSFILKIVLVGSVGISGAIWASVVGYGVLIFHARTVAHRALKNL
jgi:O-antigen/teichoic acid export membrane protein